MSAMQYLVAKRKPDTWGASTSGDKAACWCFVKLDWDTEGVQLWTRFACMWAVLVWSCNETCIGDAHALLACSGRLEQVSVVWPMQGTERLDWNQWVVFLCANCAFPVKLSYLCSSFPSPVQLCEPIRWWEHNYVLYTSLLLIELTALGPCLFSFLICGLGEFAPSATIRTFRLITPSNGVSKWFWLLEIVSKRSWSTTIRHRL